MSVNEIIDHLNAEIERLKAELETMRKLSYALKEECERQHSLTAEQFDRAEKAERERDAAEDFIDDVINSYPYLEDTKAFSVWQLERRTPSPDQEDATPPDAD